MPFSRNIKCPDYYTLQKTHAHHRLTDDVAQEVKLQRHTELAQVFREEAHLLNQAQIGQLQLVLLEGVSSLQKPACCWQC